MDQNNENPNAKRRKLTDFFQMVPTVPNNSEPQEFPGFLRRFQPTDVPCRQKHPVGRWKRSPVVPGTETSTPSRDNGEQYVERCVSLVQPLPEVGDCALRTTEF